MSRYKEYSEYVDSGVDGLGLIPNGWQIMQLKRSVDGCTNGIWGGEPTNDGSDTIVIRVADFDRPRLSVNEDGYTYRKIEEKEKTKRRLKRGDLLLEKSGGGEKTLVGQVVLFDKDFEAVTSNFVAKMTPNIGFDGRYLNYVFSRFYDDSINFCSIKQNTGIQNLDSASYLSEKFGFPSLHVQMQIARFLDYETAKIDTLIAKQQELIKLLKEKRQAVISHAVTKGLNPNAPMRDSGVEWLGEVPTHWDVLSLGKITLDKCDGPFGSGLKSEHYTETGVKVVRLQNIKMGEYFDGEGAFIDENYYKNNLRNHDVIPGDVLIAGLGDPGNPVGRACVAPTDCAPAMVKADCFRFRLNENKATPHFIAQQLSASSFFDAGKLSNGSTRARIPLSLMATRKIAICSLDEQAKILDHIVELNTKYESLEKKASSAIELMHERRTALISAAVTGKIDVRDWQPACAPELEDVAA